MKARHIIDPKSSNNLGIFIVGSIIGGFALGVGSQLANKAIEHFMNKGKEKIHHMQQKDQMNYGAMHHMQGRMYGRRY